MPGAGWVGNPYSLVGNNPVGLVDPWGLSPISVENLNKIREDQYQHSVGKWLDDNADYIKTGLLIVGTVLAVAAVFVTGGAALIALGALSGGMLAAADAMDKNKGPDGRINWAMWLLLVELVLPLVRLVVLSVNMVGSILLKVWVSLKPPLRQSLNMDRG